MKRSFLFCLVAVADLLSTSLAFGQGKIVVEGTTQDAKGKPLVGVLVEVFRANEPTREIATDSAGWYRFELTPGAQIDEIRYTRTDLDPAMVQRLAGERDQRISKVLYPTGAPRSLQATEDQLQAFWRYLFAAVSASKADRPRLASRFREDRMDARLDKLPLPAPQDPVDRVAVELLSEQKTHLLSLYGRYRGAASAELTPPLNLPMPSPDRQAQDSLPIGPVAPNALPPDVIAEGKPLGQPAP